MRMAKIKSSTLLRLALAKMCLPPAALGMDTRYTCNALAKVLKMRDNRGLVGHTGAQKALAYVKQFAPQKSPTRGDFGWFGNPDDYSIYDNVRGQPGGTTRQRNRLTAVAFAIAVAEAAGD